ncbi:MarR family transcriptional regulator [Acidovorax sp.]|uniref:MarR family winged helix-turn-helix transcriptional regulator n=1 Tax=Acidovorax sp. TaxID=1872122 RepID=UPI002639668A|nr:MarR family transcriptional regulator [Acidovorax sp.]
MTLRPRPDVFEAMHDLMHAYRARMVRAMTAVHPELTFNEMRALNFIGRHPGATQKELVHRSRADKAQVARMLGLLQDKGWLERQPNAEDKRSRCLTLSTEGAALYQALRAARQTLSASVLAGCDEATQAQLLVLLERVRSNLDALPSDSDSDDQGHSRGH